MMGWPTDTALTEMGQQRVRVDALVAQFLENHDCPAKNQMLVLTGETGELADAVLGDDKVEAKDGLDVEEEVGDVIYTAWTIAAIYGFDPIAATERVAEENAKK